MKRVSLLEQLQHASYYSSFRVGALLVCDKLVVAMQILHSSEFLRRALGLDTLENIIGTSSYVIPLLQTIIQLPLYCDNNPYQTKKEFVIFGKAREVHKSAKSNQFMQFSSLPTVVLSLSPDFAPPLHNSGCRNL